MTLGASAAVATDSGGSAAIYEVDKATALTMLTTLWQRFCNNCDHNHDLEARTINVRAMK